MESNAIDVDKGSILAHKGLLARKGFVHMSGVYGGSTEDETKALVADGELGGPGYL